VWTDLILSTADYTIVYNPTADDLSPELADVKGTSDVNDRPALEMLKLESTPSMVAERVRAGILDGTFRPGAQLAEVEIAAQLGVSRGPVREALQRLIHEGLARAERNRGVFVIDLDISDARDVYFVRDVIERAAAARLTDEPDAEVLSELAAVVDRMERMSEAPWPELVDVDLEFHRILVQGARSPRLDRTFTTLLAETRLCLLYLENFYPDRAELVAEHRGLLAAIRSGEHERAAATVSEHMSAAFLRIESDERRAPSRPDGD
jgi:DNA-binding GntR family transcriptional regulator